MAWGKGMERILGGLTRERERERGREGERKRERERKKRQKMKEGRPRERKDRRERNKISQKKKKGERERKREIGLAGKLYPWLLFQVPLESGTLFYYALYIYAFSSPISFLCVETKLICQKHCFALGTMNNLCI